MLLNCGAEEDPWEYLDSKEIKPVNPNGNQTWILIGRTDAETEAPILWPPDANSQFTLKDPDSGKDWRQKEKREAEDEMVGWHHWLNAHESEQIPGDTEGQWRLVCCSQWGCEKLDMTWWLNNNNNALEKTDSGKDWRQKEKRVAEDEMVR